MARYTLVYGIRLVPEGSLAGFADATLTLADGSTAGLTLRSIEASMPFLICCQGLQRMIWKPSENNRRDGQEGNYLRGTQSLPAPLFKQTRGTPRDRVQRWRPAERTGTRTSYPLIER
jgi:hypothetical protein